MKVVGSGIRGFVGGFLLASLFFVLLGAGSGDSVKEYIIHSYQEEENLEGWVNTKVKEGYRPVGGISITYVQYSDGKWGLHHAQAMVK